MEKRMSNKESVIAELLRVSQVLKDKGVNLKKIVLMRSNNGKSVGIKLSEIEQEGIDIGKIIEANRVKSRFSIWI